MTQLLARLGRDHLGGETTLTRHEFAHLLEATERSTRRVSAGNGSLHVIDLGELAHVSFRLVAMIGIMYFIVYRPQAKARKKLEASINDLKKGDRVLTAGGFYGDVVGTKENVIVVEIDKEKGVKIEVNRGMIAQVLPRE